MGRLALRHASHSCCFCCCRCSLEQPPQLVGIISLLPSCCVSQCLTNHIHCYLLLCRSYCAAHLIGSGVLPPFVVAAVDSAGPMRSLNLLPYKPGGCGSSPMCLKSAVGWERRRSKGPLPPAAALAARPFLLLQPGMLLPSESRAVPGSLCAGTGQGGFRGDAERWPGGGCDAYLRRLQQELMPLVQVGGRTCTGRTDSWNRQGGDRQALCRLLCYNRCLPIAQGWPLPALSLPQAEFNTSADPSKTAFGGGSFAGGLLSRPEQEECPEP